MTDAQTMIRLCIQQMSTGYLWHVLVNMMHVCWQHTMYGMNNQTICQVVANEEHLLWYPKQRLGVCLASIFHYYPLLEMAEMRG